MSQQPNPTTIIQEVLNVLDKIEARYPHDIFPPDGESQDCAGARFVRKILSEIRGDVLGIETTRDSRNEQITPKELGDRLGLSSGTMWKRLRHRHCPKTKTYSGPTGRVVTIEVTPQLLDFLSQPRSLILKTTDEINSRNPDLTDRSTPGNDADLG